MLLIGTDSHTPNGGQFTTSVVNIFSKYISDFEIDCSFTSFYQCYVYDSQNDFEESSHLLYPKICLFIYGMSYVITFKVVLVVCVLVLEVQMLLMLWLASLGNSNAQR